jgi:hypothetical protein
MSRFVKPLCLAGKLVLLLGMAVLLARCGKTSSPAPGTFGAVYAAFNSNNCVQCHYPRGSATTDKGTVVDFTSQATAYNTLFGNVAASDATGCSSVPIVSKSNPKGSYLPFILFSDYTGQTFTSSCTPLASHQENGHFSADDESSILQWIQSGAPNN